MGYHPTSFRVLCSAVASNWRHHFPRSYHNFPQRLECGFYKAIPTTLYPVPRLADRLARTASELCSFAVAGWLGG
jgi:hypothetical protein